MVFRARSPRISKRDKFSAEELGILRNKHTALNRNNRSSDSVELGPLNEGSRGALQSLRSSLLANTQNKLPRRDTSPPSLDSDSRITHCLIVFNCQSPLHVLLNQSNELVQPSRPSRFQQSEHACSEEDFSEAFLILVFLLDRFLENLVAKNFWIGRSRAPVLRGDKHVVPKANGISLSSSKS